MNAPTKLPQQIPRKNKINIYQIYSACYSNKYIQDHILDKNIDVFSINRNAELNPEMIEKFYFNLLPVTYLDWMKK